MKRGIRITFFTVLFLAGTGMLLWYLLMKREVPAHARCIPRNAVAVVTLNLRELALDHASDEHLFPEVAGKPVKALESIRKAIRATGGSGIKETADVLAFFYQDGDAAFIGVAAAVDDSVYLRKLVRSELPKYMGLHEISAGGKTLFRLDTTSAVLGWNQEIVLLLYPFSDHGAEVTAAQCAKLLDQDESASVLADENFREHELSSFDAGFWLQAKPFLAFTRGGDLFRVALHNVDYLSLAIGFREGEINMRKIVTVNKPSATIAYNTPLLVPCDPKQVKGFWHLPLDLRNDSMLDAYADAPPLGILPFGDDRTKALAKFLDGNSCVYTHDTLSYGMEYITYEYDEEFNQVPKKGFRRITKIASSTTYGVSDTTGAKKLITEWMRTDSVPFKDGAWVVSENGMEERLVLSGKLLTITNWPLTDGTQRAMPAQNLDLYFPVGEYLQSYSEGVRFFMDEDLQALLGENLGVLTMSQPLVLGNSRSSGIRLVMKNKSVNALVQLEDLAKKAWN